MPTIRVTTTTSASTGSCWNLLEDFAHIDVFNPNLSKSYLLSGDEDIGIGTMRQCDLNDGKNFIRERIIDWKPGEYYTVDIYEGSMALDRSETKIGVRPNSGGGSLVYMELNYTPSYGLVGRVMDVVLLKRMMTGMLQKVVDGLAQKATISSTHSSAAA